MHKGDAVLVLGVDEHGMAIVETATETPSQEA